MAKMTSKSGLAGKLGQAGAKAVADHKDDETVFDSGGGLPAGIEGGIARLTDCRFGIYESGVYQGEYFFIAAGTVCEPKSHNGVPIEGLRTQIGPYPIADNPKANEKTKYKTVADQIGRVLNEYRKLGIDTTGMGVDDLEPTAEALKKEGPYFRFRTWQGKPDTEGQYKGQAKPINHVWNGFCNYDPASGTASGGVTDNTAGSSAEPPTEDNTVADDSIDYTALGDTADDENAGDAQIEAQNQLQEAAEAAGLTTGANEKWFGKATWTEVAAKLAEAGGGNGGNDNAATAASEGGPEPEEGHVWYYHKTPRSKGMEAEIQKVFKNGTYNIKTLDDGAVVRSVKREQLDPDK